MKFRNIFWGMILIILGLLFTLDNLNLVDFDWYNLWRLWPVVLVLWGVSILPVKDFIKIVLVILVLAGSVTFMMNNTVHWYDNDFEFSFSDDDRDYTSVDQEFTIPFEDTVDFAKLDMEVAASKFILVDESYGLIDFQKQGSLLDYKYAIKHLDNSVDVDIYIEDDVHYKSKNKNRVEMGLNPYPVWDMQFEVGAADVELDFSGLKIGDLDIDGGAAAIKVKLGDNHNDTRVSVESGASSITMKVPEGSGCELNISAVLSGKSISGFKKIEHGLYRTENFENAENKIYIDVDAAVSSYSIIRY
jgi:hypothetical protein